jgi:hypothetical protein
MASNADHPAGHLKMTTTGKMLRTWAISFGSLIAVTICAAFYSAGHQSNRAISITPQAPGYYSSTCSSQSHHHGTSATVTCY